MPTTFAATVTQAGLNALAASVVNPPATPLFTALRILDSNEDTIATQSADFTSGAGAGFAEVTGTSVFGASSVTADVHWFELLGAGGVVLTRAQVTPALPAGVAVSIRSINLFAQGDT